MTYNMVVFMYKGKIKTLFVSVNPDILNWLKTNGYKFYNLDDYSEVEAIFARSLQEAKAIHLYEINNP